MANTNKNTPDHLNTGGAAFPIIGHENTNYIHEGMSLRDYFAAKAMQALFSQPSLNLQHSGVCKNVSESAYKIADAMIAARGGAL